MSDENPRCARTRPELLAPAGDWECLRAAAANGADAVYFGLSRFSARARAANFEPSELPAVMDFLHARNVRGFVALNTLIFPNELDEVADFARAAASAGVDAVIVQDVGLARLLSRLVPGLEVHGSTQMTLTEPRGVEWVKRLGVRRVVLARELSAADVRKVAAATDVPVEVFVHGALCVAYSGQCLTSEALGGRSANRGQCAQACRLPYELVVDGATRDLGDRAYLLSPQDLAAYDHVAELLEAGVVSFKIEGRLKTPAYVAVTTQTYRKALDSAEAGRPLRLSRREELDLAQAFSRGLSPGFLEGTNHQQLVQGRVPKARGVRVGTVERSDRRGVLVRLAEVADDLVKPGDGVVFDLGRPQDKEPGGRVFEVRRRGDCVELTFGRGAFDAAQVPAGCAVWKTDDPALRKRLEQSLTNDRPARRVPLYVALSGKVGGPLRVELSDGPNQVAVEWPGPLEVARNRPLTEADVRETFGRLGDTPFELAGGLLELPDNVLVPRSVLNNLRREAVALLLAQRQPTAPAVNDVALADLRREAAELRVPPERRATQPTLNVLVRTLEQLDAALAWRPADGLAPVGVVYCDFEDVRRYREAVPRARAAGVPIGLATLRVFKPGEDGLLNPVVTAEPDIALVRNLTALSILGERAPGLELHGDFSLNVANELTAAEFLHAGLTSLVPSFDLNWEQLSALAGRMDPNWLQPVVHQHMPMFHNEFCLYASTLSTGKDYRDCGRPCDRHKIDLRDRTGALFAVGVDAGCRNTVYNSVPQSAAEYVVRMIGLGLRRFRVDLLRETPEQVGPLLERYARVLDGRDDGRSTWRQLRAVGQLGVTRGTLSLL